MDKINIADLDVEAIMAGPQIDRAAMVPGRRYLVHFDDC